MNNDIRKKVRIKLLLLFFIPGLIIFTAVYSIQSNIEKRRANTDLEEIIQFMKEQCVRYDNILTNNRVRIQTDLIEKATELKRCMQQEDLTETQLEEYLEEQRLAGILILDRNLEIVQSTCAEEISTGLWKSAFQNQNLENAFLYPNRVLTDQIVTMDEEQYYYTAIATGDSEKIIICYENVSQKSNQEEEINIETILTGYKIERNGIVVLSD